MILLAAFLGGLACLCAAGLAARHPAAATATWILLLESQPEIWLPLSPDQHEAVIGALKLAGLALALILAVKFGPRADRYNPAFAFLWIFAAGLAHGLYPGLTLLASLRSLLGATGLFVWRFITLPAAWCRTVMATIVIAPAASVALGAVLAAAGLHPLYSMELGARLQGPGEAPFLAGFALVAIYTGLMRALTHPSRNSFLVLALNFLILLLTGARAPLALAVAVAGLAILLPSPTLNARRRLLIAAAAGAAIALITIFFAALRFLRVVNLAALGQAENLSNRQLLWPYFWQAIHGSPWLGWGLGAGKVVIPVTSALSTAVGTNAAHNEYLRIGAEGGRVGLVILALSMGLWAWRNTRPMATAPRFLLRGIFAAFAVHSWTDNTFTATTSSVFFILICALFATAPQARKPGP